MLHQKKCREAQERRRPVSENGVAQLEAWCKRNGATLRWDPLNWARARGGVVVDGKVMLTVTTSDGQLWRTGAIKSDDAIEMAERKSRMARAVLELLVVRYPAAATL
jgi:hypothetical protein